MPRKPKPDVPKLTLHKSVGQWCKTFTLPSGKRKTVYFGTEPNAAMQKYLAERDEWQAGRNPRKIEDAATDAAPATPTLAYVVNAFLERSEARVEAGDIAPVTFRDYREVAAKMVAHFGRDVEAEKLHPANFARFRHSLAKKYAPSRLSKTIVVAQMMLT